jgi:hypothetical protein
VLFGLKKVFILRKETKKNVYLYIRVCNINENPEVITLNEFQKENQSLNENLLFQIRSIFALRSLFCDNTKNTSNSIAIIKNLNEFFAISYFETYSENEMDYPIISDYLLKEWFHNNYQFFQKFLLTKLGFLLLETNNNIVFNEDYASIQKKLDNIEIYLENIILRTNCDELIGYQHIIKNNINIHINSIK